MPQAVGVYLASAYTTAAVGTAGAATAASAAAIATTASAIYAAGYAVTFAAMSYGMSAASKAMMPKQKPPALDTLGNNYTGTREPRRIIYGEQKVGGLHIIPPIATSPGGDWVHIILALAGHEVNNIGSVFFDETEITNAMIEPITGSFNDGNVGDTKFKNVANIRRYLGTSTQTLDYIIGQADPTAFTSDFRGRGIAYLAIRLQHKGDLGGPFKKGVPQITAMVQGKKCYDPRSGLTEYTNNPALCARDYLVNFCGFDASQIDDTLVAAAANICEQHVLIPPAAPATYQDRYTCNLVLEASSDWIENLKTIVNCMRGRFVYRDGKWRIYAGAWETPTLSLDQSDWIGPMRVRASAPVEERWNAVRVWYTDQNRNYARSECYPRRNTTYETADGDLIWLELELPGCNNDYEAQRHGEFMLRQSRNQLKITGRLRPAFGALSTWDTVQVTDTEYGWSSKTFRVASMDINPNGEVDVSLIEEGSATWTDLAVADYNAITTRTTLDPGETLPSERLDFAVTAYAGALEFSWDTNVNSTPTRMSGEQTRLLEYPNSGAYATSGTEIWRGVANRVNIPKADTTTRFYYIQGVVGSATGPYTPNTYGYGMGALTGGANGADGVMVGLTLPAVTLPASANGNVTDYSAAQGTLQVVKAGVDVTTYAATRASSQAGVTGTVNSDHGLPWAANSKGAYRVTACTSDIGVLWTEAVYSGTTYVRPFVVSKARGAAVNTAPILNLISTGQVFRFSGSGTVIGVSTIGFDAVITNAPGGAAFRANNYLTNNTMIASYALSGAGDTGRGLHVSSFTQGGSTAYCIVTASVDPGLYDQISVVRVQEGADGLAGQSALIGYLTNEAHVIPSSSNGAVAADAYTGAAGTFVLMLGLSSVHPNSITYSIPGNPQALTSVISPAGTFVVSGGLDAGESQGLLTLRAVYSNSTVEKLFTLGKALGGTAANTAATLDLVATAQAFSFSGSGTVIGVSTIGFDALLQNVGGTVGIYANNYDRANTMIASYALSGTGNSNRGLHVNSFTQGGSTAYSRVVASLDPGLYDIVTISKLVDGAPARGQNLTPWTLTDPFSSTMGQWVMLAGSYDNCAIHRDVRDPWGGYSSAVRIRGTGFSSGWLGSMRHAYPVENHATYINYVAFQLQNLGRWAYGGYTTINSCIEDAAGAAYNNGYFINGVGSSTTFRTGEWYLGVGIVHPASATLNSSLQGVYHFLTGSKTMTTSFARQVFGATSEFLRFGAYVTPGAATPPDSSDAVYFLPIGTWLMDGSHPTVEEVLNNLGRPAVTPYLTNENHTIPASSNGAVAAPFSVGGAFVLVEGVNSVNVGSITFSTPDNPQTLTHVFSVNGTFRVTDGFDAGEDTATLTLRAAYRGGNYDKVFTLGKSKSGAVNTAATLDLLATGQAFRFSGSGTNIGVSTIGFDVLLQNVGGTAGIYANNYLSDNTLIVSYELSGTGNANRGLHVNSFLSAGSTAYARVVASLSPGLYDQVTVLRVQEGADGQQPITGYLTNENHTIPSSSNGYVADYGAAYTGAGGYFVMMLGTNSINPNSVTFALAPGGNPQALGYGVNGVGSYKVEAGFDPGEDTATLTLRATYSGTAIDRVFSLNKGKAGTVGGGSFALNATGQQFRYSGSGTNIGVSTLGFYVAMGNLSGTAAIYANNFLADGTLINSVTLAGPVNSYWLFHVDSFTQAGSTAYAAVVTSMAGGWTDRVSVLRIAEGAGGLPGLVGYLTNEVHTLPASADGSVGAADYGGAAGTFVLMLGANSVHPNSITYSINQNPQTLTSVISPAGTYVVSGGLDPGEALATLTLRAVYSGATLDKIFTLAKSKAGLPGGMGPPGANILPNGDFTKINSITGRLANWDGGVTTAHTYAAAGGPDGNMCLVVGSYNSNLAYWNETRIPVSPLEEVLDVEVWMRSPTSGQYVYLAMMCLDRNNVPIELERDQVRALFKTNTYIPIGATSLSIVKPSSADQYFHNIGGYANSYGYVTPSLYSPDQTEAYLCSTPTLVTTKNTTASTSIDILGLATAWPTSTGPDTYLSYGVRGNTFRYWPDGAVTICTSTWTRYTYSFRGLPSWYLRNEATEAYNAEPATFRNGTRAVQFGFVRNTGGVESDLYVAGYVVQRRAYTRANQYILDPDCLMGGGAWYWNLDVSSCDKWVRYSATSGPAGGGVLVFKPGSLGNASDGLIGGIPVGLWT